MIVVPDLAGPCHFMDKDNKIVANVGEGLAGNPPRDHRRPEQVRSRPVREPARRDVSTTTATSSSWSGSKSAASRNCASSPSAYACGACC